MIKFILKIIPINLLFICFNTYAQVGIGNSDPKGILDTTNSNNYPIVIPVASSETDIINPNSSDIIAGSLFYDSTVDCLKVYNGTTWDCIGKEQTGGIALNCNVVNFGEDLILGTNYSGTFTLPVSYLGIPGNLSLSTPTLGGVFSGMNITPNPINIALGQGNSNFIYSISGTVSSEGTGSIIINELNSECEYTKEIKNPAFTFENCENTLTLNHLLNGVELDAEFGTVTIRNNGGAGILQAGTVLWTDTNNELTLQVREDTTIHEGASAVVNVNVRGTATVSQYHDIITNSTIVSGTCNMGQFPVSNGRSTVSLQCVTQPIFGTIRQGENTVLNKNGLITVVNENDLLEGTLDSGTLLSSYRSSSGFNYTVKTNYTITIAPGESIGAVGVKLSGRTDTDLKTVTQSAYTSGVVNSALLPCSEGSASRQIIMYLYILNTNGN